MSITSICLPTRIPAAAVPLDPEAERRAAFVAGLHDLGAALETNPEIPLPTTGRLDPVTFHFLAGDDPRAAMNAAAKALGCPVWREGTADYRETGGGVYDDLNGWLHGLRLRLVAPGDGGDPDDDEAAEATPEAEPESDAEAETDDGTEAA